MLGLGGVLGSVIGGVMTEYAEARYCFYFTSVLGLLVSIQAFLMSKSMEIADQNVITLSLKQRIKFTFVCIKDGLKIREMYRSVIFFFLIGIIVPSFSEYLYFYQMYVSKFTQFEFAMIHLIGYAATFVSSVLYNWCFKNYEERTLLAFAMVVNTFGSIMTLIYVLGLIGEIPPLVFVICTSTATDTIYLALSQMPSMVLFAKLIPSQIESSMFALLMGLLNLSYYTISKLIGNGYNKFFNVNKDNMDDIWKLYVIETIGCALPLAFIWLLPSKQEVYAVQRVIEYQDKKAAGQHHSVDISKIDLTVAKRVGVEIELGCMPNPEKGNEEAALEKSEVAG